MRTPEEFEKQAKIKNITFWESHECGICGCPVGTEIENGEASYRSACDCACSPNNSYGWEFVAKRYNMQTSQKVIDEMNKFWGFE